MENIQLLHQELNARGDKQVGEVVAVDLKKENARMLDLQKSHYWNFRSAKRVSLIDCFDQIRFTNKHLELELD